jgi:hypothetical protein
LELRIKDKSGSLDLLLIEYDGKKSVLKRFKIEKDFVGEFNN